jgi:hypothetical protein
MSNKFNKKETPKRDESVLKSRTEKNKSSVNGRRRSASYDTWREKTGGLNSSFSNHSQEGNNSQSRINNDVEMNENSQLSLDDVSLLNNGIFRNNTKSGNEPVRQLFEIVKVKKENTTSYQGICTKGSFVLSGLVAFLA